MVLDKIGSDLTLRDSIRTRKLKYFGHISIEKLIIQGAVDGRRGRGRPITAWTDSIKYETGSLAAATHAARDRDGWRALVRTTSAVPLDTMDRFLDRLLRFSKSKRKIDQVFTACRA